MPEYHSIILINHLPEMQDKFRLIELEEGDWDHPVIGSICVTSAVLAPVDSNTGHPSFH